MTRSYGYSFTNNEANWGPTIADEVEGGSHLTFEIPLRFRNQLVGLLLKEGIHGADNSVLYFPHDLIRIGESVDECVARIVKAIANVEVVEIQHLYLETWLDDISHYHICHNVLATIDRMPKSGGNTREVHAFDRSSIPSLPFAWWTREDLLELFEDYF